MATRTTLLNLAAQLPPRLLRFFAEHPPPPIVELMSNKPTHSQDPNPFQPLKHPVTGRWRGAKFGLRRQADFVKMARTHGVEELLPFTIKGTQYKLQKRLDKGVKVAGVGEGKRVKGKAWERDMKGKLEKRRKAMLEMPQMIQTWKERGHGRGWKKWPKI